MKKSVLVLILVLAILASVVTGTLAVYQVKIDELAGDVVAKKFVFLGEGKDGFNSTLKIAPRDGTKNKDDVIFAFSLSNFDNANVSETPMIVDISVDIVPHVEAVTGANKSITPLRYIFSKVDENGNVVRTYTTIRDVTDGHSFWFKDFFEENLEQTYTYKFQVIWEETNNDSDYRDCGNTIKVNATATQFVGNLDPTGEAVKMKGKLDKFVQELQTPAQIEAFKTKHGLTYLNNDILKEIFQRQYQNSLPIVYNDNEVLMIQPYFFMDGDRPTETVLFACKSLSSNWYTSLVFDDTKSVWRKSVSSGTNFGFSVISVEDESGKNTREAVLKFITEGGTIKYNDPNGTVHSFIDLE